MFIHINSNVIKSNKKHNKMDPPITVRRVKSKVEARYHELIIDGPCKIVYAPDRPLPCGARVWIETDAPLLEDNRCREEEV